MQSQPGTYALIMFCPHPAEIQVGKLGPVQLQNGIYVYTGSAFGPGGIKARVLRHCRTNKQRHWHMDYLREALIPKGAWYSHDKQRLEHHWARRLSENTLTTQINRFGCSDCSCASHLFYMPKLAEKEFFRNTLQSSNIGYWTYSTEY